MSIKSVENKFQGPNCFEIFGYDFMLDTNLVPWLIEVNTNPSLEESSQILKEYLPRMLDDAFKLTIDQVFRAPYNIKQEDFPVSGHPDSANLWDHFYTMPH